jgi:hypothetical protein
LRLKNAAKALFSSKLGTFSNIPSIYTPTGPYLFLAESHLEYTVFALFHLNYVRLIKILLDG